MFQIKEDNIPLFLIVMTEFVLLHDWMSPSEDKVSEAKSTNSLKHDILILKIPIQLQPSRKFVEPVWA